MFSLIKQVFIVLLSFSESLPRVAKVFDQTKYLFLNYEPCMVRPTLVDLNLVELKYYPFISRNIYIYLHLSPEICVPKETKTYMLMHLR